MYAVGVPTLITLSEYKTFYGTMVRPIEPYVGHWIYGEYIRLDASG